MEGLAACDSIEHPAVALVVLATEQLKAAGDLLGWACEQARDGFVHHLQNDFEPLRQGEASPLFSGLSAHHGMDLSPKVDRSLSRIVLDTAVIAKGRRAAVSIAANAWPWNSCGNCSLLGLD